MGHKRTSSGSKQTSVSKRRDVVIDLPPQRPKKKKKDHYVSKDEQEMLRDLVKSSFSAKERNDRDVSTDEQDMLLDLVESSFSPKKQKKKRRSRTAEEEMLHELVETPFSMETSLKKHSKKKKKKRRSTLDMHERSCADTLLPCDDSIEHAVAEQLTISVVKSPKSKKRKRPMEEDVCSETELPVSSKKKKHKKSRDENGLNSIETDRATVYIPSDNSVEHIGSEQILSGVRSPRTKKSKRATKKEVCSQTDFPVSSKKKKHKKTAGENDLKVSSSTQSQHRQHQESDTDSSVVYVSTKDSPVSVVEIVCLDDAETENLKTKHKKRKRRDVEASGGDARGYNRSTADTDCSSECAEVSRVTGSCHTGKTRRHHKKRRQLHLSSSNNNAAVQDNSSKESESVSEENVHNRCRRSSSSVDFTENGMEQDVSEDDIDSLRAHLMNCFVQERRVDRGILNKILEKQDFTPIHGVQLQQYINIDWELPQVHDFLSISGKSVMDGLQTLKNNGIDVSDLRFSPNEDDILLGNWQKLQEMLGIEDPTEMRALHGHSFGHKSEYRELRLRFYQYLGKGLNNRSLPSIRRRFQALIVSERRHRNACRDRRSFTPDEDGLLLGLFEILGCQYEQIGKIFKRSHFVIQQRIDILQWEEARQTTRVSDFFGKEDDLQLAKAVYKYCYSVDARNSNNSSIPWKKISAELNEPVPRLRGRWDRKLKLLLNLEKSHVVDKVKLDLVWRIQKKNYNHRLEINWDDIRKELPEFPNSLYLPVIFHNMMVCVPQYKTLPFNACLEKMLQKIARRMERRARKPRIVPCRLTEDGKLEELQELSDSE